MPYLSASAVVFHYTKRRYSKCMYAPLPLLCTVLFEVELHILQCHVFSLRKWNVGFGLDFDVSPLSDPAYAYAVDLLLNSVIHYLYENAEHSPARSNC